MKKKEQEPIYKKLLRLSADDRLSAAILLPLSVFLLDLGVLSLKWRMVHDSPLFHYVSFLSQRHNYVIYKDVFETSMPGIFVFHSFITKVFGYSASAFRAVDIVWLAILLAVTWQIMKPLGKRVAWGSVVLFGLSYFQLGPMVSLQRDYIGILPVCLAVLLVTATSGGHPYRYWKSFIAGFLFGLSATIKPHLAIGLPLVLFFLWRETADNSKPSTAKRSLSGLYICLAAIMGFAIPLLTCFFWLWRNGALPYFLEMASTYLPLHLGLTYGHRAISGTDRIIYLIRSFKELGGLHIWLLPGFFGFFLAVFDLKLPRREKNLIYLLAGLTALYSIYPVFAGQFWGYHWMPFQYFVILFASLALLRIPEQLYTLRKRLFPIIILGLSVFLALDSPVSFSGQLLHIPEIYPPVAWENGRVDEITGFLKSKLKPGDRVQPLDWTGGAVHAMLLSKAQAATPYIYDYHFYHHISTPYIQKLRQHFINKFIEVMPRFVIEVDTDKPWVSGPNTTRDFKELQNILETYYSITYKGNGYNILELRKP